jgi:hypothetical protein
MIFKKLRQPAVQIMWGNHYRAGIIIETGKVTTHEDADMVEVIVDDGKPKTQTHVEVNYAVGNETFKTRVKKGTTIAEFRETLSYRHKGKQIVGIAFDGDEIAQEDAVDAWLTRSLNTPLHAMLARLVQVILEWRGRQFHLAVRERTSEKDFKKDAEKRLSITKKTHTRIKPLGLDAWSVRAGHVYAVMERRKMQITLDDVKGQPHRIQIEGDISRLLRTEWRLQPWIRITVKRADNKPFWVEDKGDYSVVTQYDRSLDLRPEITVRVDLVDRTVMIENHRAAEDPVAIWEDIWKCRNLAPPELSSRLDRGNPAHIPGYLGRLY